MFHYEFEFIHPFSDGNGRMNKMWHSLLLSQWKEIFFWLPVEELIQSRQEKYYETLGISDQMTDCTLFVALMLTIIRDSLKEMTVIVSDTDQDKSPVDRLLAVMNDETLSASELMKRLGLSHCQTFRKNYLNPAMERNLIEPTVPDKPNSKNQKYRKIK